MKYYFLTLCRYQTGVPVPIFVCSVSLEHPFEFLKRLQKSATGFISTVVSFQEISKEEYELFESLEL